jgi:hypothetical protein
MRSPGNGWGDPWIHPDEAHLAGFESQESFTRAFRKAFAMTPCQFRKLGRRNLFLRKAQFDADYLRHITTNLTTEPEVVHSTSVCLGRMMQNSLPSGSASTIHGSSPVCPTSTGRAPKAMMRSISPSRSSARAVRSR